MPPGGYAELFTMSESERSAWYRQAVSMKGFQWLKTIPENPKIEIHAKTDSAKADSWLA